MKATTLNNRLAKAYTGAKNANHYRIVRDIIEGTNKTGTMRENGIVRPDYTTGSGRFKRNVQTGPWVMALLDWIGVKYEAGNDAPRGGMTGNYIKIKTKIER